MSRAIEAMNGNDHDREDDAGRQDADTGGHARIEDGADDGHALDDVRDRDLHVIREERREDEEAPHAVDDARHRGEQLDGGRHGPLEPGRAELREEDRDAEGERDADDEGDQGGRQGADDGDPGAVLVLA